MNEPTHSQHLLLQFIEEEGGFIYRQGDEDDIDKLYELVRGGHLMSLAMMGGPHEWKFKLTETGQNYLNETI